MPYPGLDADQSAKVDKCVEDVMATGKPKENAIPICIASVTGKSEKEVREMLGLSTKESWRTGVGRDLPIRERGEWDASTATQRVFSWAGWPDDPNPSKARQAFLVYDAENDENQGAYKLPIADVVNGRLQVVDQAMRAAASRLPQTDAPQDVLDRARSALDSYFEKLRETEKESHLLDRIVGRLREWMGTSSKEESLDAFRERVYASYRAQFPQPGYMENGSWVMEVYPTYAIVCVGQNYFRVPFTSSNGDIAFAALPEWTQVERRQEWIDKANQLAKEGRRHSSKDQDALQMIHDNAVTLGAECPMVTKQADGRWRWVMLSSNAYEDTDGEIVSLKALQADVDRADLTGDYGTLDWWHVPMLKLGAADFNAMQGNVLVESGTFYDNRVGEATSSRLKKLQGSLTFFHPMDEPDKEGVFHHIRRAGRALLPAGRAANLLTALPAVAAAHSAAKESNMPTLKEKWTEFVGLLDGNEQLAQQVVKDAEAVEKQAAEMRLRHKQQAEGQAQAGQVPAAPAAAAPIASPPAQAGLPTAKQAGQIPLPDPPTPSLDTATLIVALKQTMQPVVDAVNALSVRVEGQSSKEAGEQAARAKQIADLQAQIKQHQDALTNLSQSLKELTDDQPRGSGFRPSQSPETILVGAEKQQLDQQLQPDPMSNFLTGLGLIQPGAH